MHDTDFRACGSGAVIVTMNLDQHKGVTMDPRGELLSSLASEINDLRAMADLRRSTMLDNEEVSRMLWEAIGYLRKAKASVGLASYFLNPDPEFEALLNEADDA